MPQNIPIESNEGTLNPLPKFTAVSSHQLETISSYGLSSSVGGFNKGHHSIPPFSEQKSITTHLSNDLEKYCKSDDESHELTAEDAAPPTSSTEGALFAARLFGDGIPIRKIKRNGSTHTRIVRCLHVLLDPLTADSSQAAVGSIVTTGSPPSSSFGSPSPASSTASSTSRSLARSKATTPTWRAVPSNTPSSVMALAWGKAPSPRSRRPSNRSKDSIFLSSCRTVIPLSAFAFVRLGKTTERAHKNTSASPDLILSIHTNQSQHASHYAVTWPPSLDIEAQTQADRDSLANSFAEFLRIPILSTEQPPQSDDGVDERLSGPRRKGSESGFDVPSTSGKPPAPPRSSNNSSGGSANERFIRNRAGWSDNMSMKLLSQSQHETSPDTLSSTAYPPPLPPSASSHQQQPSLVAASSNNSTSSRPNTASQGVLISIVDGGLEASDSRKSSSDVSTLTGHGFDQELVEELHHALNEMRAELEESRAEAARAVKVAEQAIQSAERSNSVEWQNTVTHKAAEAAAMAQKRSAEAMARQRVAEERLEQEKRNAAFWRKQAEIAEEEAGSLQTRVAAAEVQRATLEEKLESEYRKSAALQDFLQRRLNFSEGIQHDALQVALERNRVLEIQVEKLQQQLATRKDWVEKGEEKYSAKKRLSLSRKQKATSESRVSLLPKANSPQAGRSLTLSKDNQQSSSLVAKLVEEAGLIREQFELLRRLTSDELSQIPNDSQQWCELMKAALCFAHNESERLRQSLALETASRRLLQHEVADLRGSIRVYCRQQPPRDPDKQPVLRAESHQTISLYRNQMPGMSNDDSLRPLSFEFDRVFPPEAAQTDIYQEMEEVVLGVLEGYKACVIAYGNAEFKTNSLLGDVRFSESGCVIHEKGLQLLALEQLFTVSEHRSDRYRDSFQLSILEVTDERVTDLLASTNIGEERGEVIMVEGRKKKSSGDNESSSSKAVKLEIRSDDAGEVVVHGSLYVQVSSFEDVLAAWSESLLSRRARLQEQGVNINEYDASSHTIATVKIKSINIATGLGSVGKIQFVDLAAARLVAEHLPQDSEPKMGVAIQELTRSIYNEKDICWKFDSRWANIFGEVIVARSQYSRVVPYRNSTLTHLLSDCLEHDTKVIFLACLPSEAEDAQASATALRLASRARRVWLGKATKHSIDVHSAK